MSTVAQDIYEGNFFLDAAPQVIVPHLRSYMKGVRKSLSPDALNTERYVFPMNAPNFVAEQIEAGYVTVPAIMDMLRLPAPVTWIEWSVAPEEGVPVAYAALLAEKRDEPYINVLAFMRVAGTVAPMGAIQFPEFPWGDGVYGGPVRSGVYIDLDYARAHGFDWNPEALEDTLRDTIFEALFCLFMLCVPRACETVESIPSERLQRNRARRRKPPLISHTMVNMQVGAPRKVRAGAATEATGTGPKRGLHAVSGHFRTLHEGKAGRTKARVTWVPRHWRGDPALGVHLHTRKVNIVREEK